MGHLSIRDLQKISGEAICALPGVTAVKSGRTTVGLLIPLRKVDPEALATLLARAEVLGRGRDANADDEALRQFGEVDPVNWSEDLLRTPRQPRD